MARCDFASIMAVVRDGFSDGYFESNVALIEALFFEYQDEHEQYMDRSYIGKWLNGTKKVSEKIVDFYTFNPTRTQLLANSIHDSINYALSDRAGTIKNVQNLLVCDPSISETKKKQLCALREEEGDEYFLAAVLIFGMRRPFVAHDIRKPEAQEERSPMMRDYIFDDGVPKPTKAFCGREQELAELHETMKENDKVFLYGIAGIGKSEIARAYAGRHRKEYTNVLYLTYTGSLHRDIADMQFADDLEDEDEDTLFKRHNKALRTLRADTLLVIDNFDTVPAQESLLSTILKYRCRILFTTRSVFANQTCMEIREISDRETLFRLAETYFTEAEKHRSIVENILLTVHYHTLSVELAARLLARGILPPEELLAKLQEERAAFDAKDKISISKDGTNSRASYRDHLHTLFALFGLDPDKCYAMRCMAMIPLSGIHGRLFAKWAGFSDMNTIEDLIELGLVRDNSNLNLSLHPMLRDVTIADLKPGVENCRTLLTNIGNFCADEGREQTYRKLILRTAGNILRDIEQDDKNFLLQFTEQVFVTMRQPGYENQLRVLVDGMEALLNDPDVGVDEDRAAFYTYRAYLSHQNNERIQLFKKAIEVFPTVTAENAPELYRMHSELADAYRRARKQELAVQHMQTAFQLMNRYRPDQAQSGEEIGMILRQASLWNDTGKFKKANEILLPMEQQLSRTQPNSMLRASVLRILSAVTANLGDADQGLEYLQQSWEISQVLAGDNEEMLRHYQQVIGEIRAAILAERGKPGRFVGGVM